VDISARVSHLSATMQASMGEFASLRGMLQGGAAAAHETSERIDSIGNMVAANTARIDEMSRVLQQQSLAVHEISTGVDRIAVRARASTGYAEEVIRSVAKSEALINEQFTDLEQRTIRNYVLYRAKSDHCLWKKRLSEMFVGLNQLKPGELSDHRQCRLGKWYGQLSDQAMRNKPAFRALEAPHALVHTHGRKAVELFAQGNKEGAATQIAAMERASVDVIRLLDDLLR
jgi:methyl-accepting chemotaxis protein